MADSQAADLGILARGPRSALSALLPAMDRQYAVVEESPLCRIGPRAGRGGRSAVHHARGARIPGYTPRLGPFGHPVARSRTVARPRRTEAAAAPPTRVRDRLTASLARAIYE
jgi:hypothetical protein